MTVLTIGGMSIVAFELEIFICHRLDNSRVRDYLGRT